MIELDPTFQKFKAEFIESLTEEEREGVCDCLDEDGGFRGMCEDDTHHPRNCKICGCIWFSLSCRHEKPRRCPDCNTLNFVETTLDDEDIQNLFFERHSK
ncbi:hypothetical protein [Brevundimonas olei]|uniref:hypothetical protein n=1 Tax=Brevundimonas olei TaxID=657642 RepID=UPI0031CEE521